MKRDKNDPNLKAWASKNRLRKVSRIMQEEGVNTSNVELLLEIVIKDKASVGQMLDHKMMGVLINFLKVKAMEKQTSNPLDKALASAKDFEKDDE